MREDRRTQDPYAPPPRHKDRSGGLVRFVLIAAMLAAAGTWAYTEYANGPSQSLVADNSAQEQQVADAGYQAYPEAMPEAAPAPTPAPSAAPTAPAPAAPTESVPPPSTTITP